jgi:hypothetical protein
VPGEGGEPVGRAEADQDQPGPRVVMGLVHLDQVLLAGQSMPVAQQHQDLHAADLTKDDRLPGGRFGEPQVGDIDMDGFRLRH